MKVEDIGYESKSTASSLLSRKGDGCNDHARQSDGFLVSLSRRGLHKFGGEHEHGVREDLGRRVNFVLASTLHEVRVNGKDDDAGYDLFRSSGMNETTKVLGDVLKPGEQKHVSCYALHFALGYKALSLEEKKSESVTGNIPAKAGLSARRATEYNCSQRF